MDIRTLHTHPLFVWISLGVGVVGLAFAFWTWWANIPVRSISYTFQSRVMLPLDDYDLKTVTLDGHQFVGGRVYVTNVYVWNSGNQEIQGSMLRDPLEWADQPSLPRIKLFGISGLAAPVGGGYSFERLYPDTGIRLTYLTSYEITDVNMTGSLEGEPFGGAIIKYDLKQKRFNAWLVTGFTWLIFSAIFLKHLWHEPSHYGRVGALLSRLGGAILFAIIPAMVALMIALGLVQVGLPSFYGS